MQEQTTAVKQKNQAVRLVLFACALVVAACLFVLPVSKAYADEGPVIQSGEQSGSSQPNEGDSSGLAGGMAVSEEDTVSSTDLSANSTDSSANNSDAYEEEDLISAQTSQSGTTIPDASVPLAEATTQIGFGSILNTLLVAICIITMLVMFVALLISKTKDYRVIAARTVAAAVGLVTIAAWSLLDKMQAPAALVNDATLLIASLFCIYAILLVYSYLYEARLKKARQEQGK